MKSIVSLIFTFLLLSNLNAQPNTRTITGIVTTESDQTPLEGVTVKVKGTKNYSGSQPDGIFYIAITPKDSVLVFSYQGFHPREIKITHDTEYAVALKRSATQINILQNEAANTETVKIETANAGETNATVCTTLQ